MPDTVKLNGKEYTVKEKLSFGDVRKFQRTIGGLVGLSDKLKSAKDDELEQLASDSMKSQTQQMELVSNTIMKCLGFTDKQVDKLSFPEAVTLFNEIYASSTEIKKNSNPQYG